jgi:pyruvate/2-oxoglutarate/acetoin dehydrogenase E1 component
LGLALASKKFKNAGTQNNHSNQGNEVSFCVIGDAATSEGVFFETVNAAGVMQVPIVFVIQDDGYGISVPTKYQTTKGSISEILKGFQTNNKGIGLDLYQAKAWDYATLNRVFKKAVDKTRQLHTPCIIHVTECTQPNGHSTSGSHERYKTKQRLKWEKEIDGIHQMEQWIIRNNILNNTELSDLKIAIAANVKEEKLAAWQAYITPIKTQQEELMAMTLRLEEEFPASKVLSQLNTELKLANSLSDILRIAEKIRQAFVLKKSETISSLKSWYADKKAQLTQRYDTHLYSNSNKAAINIPARKAQFSSNSPHKNGYQILNQYFDQLIANNKEVYAFGEDVGNIGGVNQAFAGLQKKYGENRVFDTGIREWTIIGQAIGMAMRGLRPIAEIQYIDYLVYALPALTDDLACLRWRTNGQQMAPAIIRTRGHRLEGVWHSGSPMGLLLNSLRGIYLLTPRNMTQAAGMYNTMLQSDDPAIIVECLNGYRVKEQLPDNLEEFTVPLGVPEVLVPGKDLTLVTYGSCVRVAAKAVASLAELGISVELIDVQSLLPFDLEHQIVESVKKTNRLIVLDEDVPGGASAYIMRELLEVQGAYNYLDSKPISITAKSYRPPYGDDGNYISKPTEYDVISQVIKTMYEVNPQIYSNLAALI